MWCSLCQHSYLEDLVDLGKETVDASPQMWYSGQKRRAQELHELGQWPMPPSYLELHLGPNLEISNLLNLFYNIIHL